MNEEQSHISTVTLAIELKASAPLLVPPELQALVCDIPPSTTAVFSYAIGSRKLTADEQFLLVLKQ